MKAIIIDDEPKAIELLKGYLQHFSTIELGATFRNGLKAFEYLSNEPVDIIFLDINMPHISGISLSKMIPKNVHIIFTTAYSEYAVESYEVEAIDYLLKPISLDRFTQAISKILKKKASNYQKETQNHWILVKSGFETFRIATQDILYLEKEGNYITYHCENEKVLGRETIQQAIEKLPDNFIQTHKSFIVNTDKIKRYDRNVIFMGDHEIPVSDSFSQRVFSQI
jgi:two-component system, LytTR family, response regulator